MTPTTHCCRVLGSPWPGIHVASTDSSRHYARHWHDTFGIGWLESGAHTSASGRGTVEAYAGDLLATNPGEVHDGRPLGGASRRWHTVYLDYAALTNALGLDTADVDALEITRPVIHDRQLQAVLRGLLSLLEAWNAQPLQGAADRLAFDEALVRTWAALEHHTNVRPQADAPANLARVRERLADALCEPPSLAELSQGAGISRFQLVRHFRAAYGLTPYAWLLQQRAARARSLIAAGVRLADAAARSGFADQSHMTRSFVGQFGFTPGAWRKAMAPRRLQ